MIEFIQLFDFLYFFFCFVFVNVVEIEYTHLYYWFRQITEHKNRSISMKFDRIEVIKVWSVHYSIDHCIFREYSEYVGTLRF